MTTELIRMTNPTSFPTFSFVTLLNMAHIQIKPFHAVHPPSSDASRVASVPYDVINSVEATEIASGNPDSFMHVVRSEVDLPEDCSPYDKKVYAKARENYEKLLQSGSLIKDPDLGIYLYRQCTGDHHQVGIVACCHVDDYNKNLIKKHEKTMQVKEDDRTNHVLGLNANAGPVFLTYRGHDDIDAIVAEEMINRPMFHFVADDGVTHTGWRVENQDALLQACSSIDFAYVADGHHRSASAARAAAEKRIANPNHDGSEEYNWFLAVLFPASQLDILAYNRIVLDLNGFTPESLIEALARVGKVTKTVDPIPEAAGTFCIYLGKDYGWYKVVFDPDSIDASNPIASLDVDLLQQRVLTPLLGVGDPQSDNKIDFVGGIRGTRALEERVDSGNAAVAFSMYHTTIDQLLDVANAGLIMPPKSTWFEPKLRSGLFVHELS